MAPSLHRAGAGAPAEDPADHVQPAAGARGDVQRAPEAAVISAVETILKRSLERRVTAAAADRLEVPEHILRLAPPPGHNKRPMRP